MVHLWHAGGVCSHFEVGRGHGCSGHGSANLTLFGVDVGLCSHVEVGSGHAGCSGHSRSAANLAVGFTVLGQIV